MAARDRLGSLRATLSEERSRLGKVLDQIDEALDCLEPGASKELAAPPSKEISFASKEESDRPAAVHAIREAAHAGRRIVPERTKSQMPVAAWDAQGKSHTKNMSLEQLDEKNPSPPARPLRSPTAAGVAAPSSAKKEITAAPPRAVSQTSGGRKSQRREQRKSQHGRQIFANADQMKEQVQKAILEPEYNVKNMYKEEGIWARIARSTPFDVSSLVVIVLNALWLGVETDYNDEALLFHAEPPFVIVEFLFCAFFVWELVVRFMAFKVKADTMKDSWFMFDTVLVSFMAFETWILYLLVWMTGGALGANSSSTSVLRVVRLFRMTRAARVAKLLKAVPELMVIGRGIVIVARTVVVIMCLLVMIIYTFAIVFTQLAKGTSLESTICSGMSTTMVTLLLGGILPDFAPTTEAMYAEDFFFALFFFVFILLAYVTIMNMLIGVLVEVVAVVASVEKETNQVASVKRVLQKWAPVADKNGDNLFGVTEFKNMLNKDGCARDLNDVGVDAIALIDHADFVYRNKEELTFSELLTVVLGLRGRNETKVQDIVQLRKFLQVEMQRIEWSLENLHIRLVGESGRPEAPEDAMGKGDQAVPPQLPPPQLPSMATTTAEWC